MFVSFPQLYLASGVTTARTAGSMDPYGDLGIKREIEAGRLLGPDLDLTTPYLEGAPPLIRRFHPLRDAADARALVRYWASLGFTSAKAYMNITSAELAAAIDEAHRHGMKITGHICSVGYEEAVAARHRQSRARPVRRARRRPRRARTPGRCARPRPGSVIAEVVQHVAPDAPAVQRLIRLLVARHVPVTSTLAVLEGGDRPDLDAIPHLHDLLAPDIWAWEVRRHAAEHPASAFYATMLGKEMAFERAFAAAGGVLMAGCDPTGDGHVIAGLGDQRNIELLHEAGFTIPEAIRIATLNGAIYLGRAASIGSLEVGKHADIVLLDGDLIARRPGDRASARSCSRTASATTARRSMRASAGRSGCMRPSSLSRFGRGQLRSSRVRERSSRPSPASFPHPPKSYALGPSLSPRNGRGVKEGRCRFTP